MAAPAPVTASDIYKEARLVFLNDQEASSGSMYTNEKLLPHLQYVMRRLSLTLSRHNSQIVRDSEAEIDIEAGDITLDQPDDLILAPTGLEKRDNDNSWVEVQESENGYITAGLLENTTGDIVEWTWRDGFIRLGRTGTGADQIRVRLLYRRGLATPIGDNSVMEIPYAKPYLSAAVASRAASYIGENGQLAAHIAFEAESALNDLIGQEINPQQSKSFRRTVRRFGQGGRITI